MGFPSLVVTDWRSESPLREEGALGTVRRNAGSLRSLAARCPGMIPGRLATAGGVTGAFPGAAPAEPGRV